MDRLQFAIEAAREAGAIAMRYFQSGVGFDLKENETPVTVADREVEAHIRRRIQAAFPGEAIWGEEEGKSGEALDRWVIDPIDGTKSFVAGVPLFAVLLSYEVAGLPVVGVSHFPALEWLLHASKGQGAFANGQPIRVSTQTDRKRSMICCGGHASMEKHGRTQGILKLARECMGTRTWCDAYGHCLVASGRAEAMIDPVVARYDISAIQLIVEEAGGRVTDFHGASNPQVQAVSSNGLLHERVLAAFA